MKSKLTLEEPYFMKNEDWYYFDELEFKYKLTDKAPNEAIKSYKDYYDLIDETGLIKQSERLFVVNE